MAKINVETGWGVSIMECDVARIEEAKAYLDNRGLKYTIYINNKKVFKNF